MSYDYKLTVLLNTNYKPLRFRVEGKSHYQMILGIDSKNDPGLDSVIYVKYKLHPTFKDRLRVSSDKANKFQIELLAWGTFEVGVIIGMQNNEVFEFTQDMSEVLKKVSL